MDFSSYNEIIRNWTQEIMDNRTQDAEITLRNCNNLLELGTKMDDPVLIGFSYYYIAETYYCLNDGNVFFDNITKAIENLEKGKCWEMIAKSYNILGIVVANSGNAPIALDYYLNGMEYCKKYNIPQEEMILNINCGALNVSCGRHSDALKYLKAAYDYIIEHPEHPRYHSLLICIYENMAMSKIANGDYNDVGELFEIIYQRHWPFADYIDRLAVLCAETIFHHRVGDRKKRDDCISQVDKCISQNAILLDMFDDYYKYCELLLECGKDKEFWSMIDVLEPMVRNFKITNMQLREISLKIKYYRKHHQSAEYLQAAGLYYELSEQKERENHALINNMIELRKSLEHANRVRHEIERKNQLLEKKSSTDALTKLANRFKLNDYADEIFENALKNQESVAIEILDIDYFKEYNDNYGHQKGDDCLCKIADVLRSMEEEHGAFCARYGGDEFILIYRDTDMLKADYYASDLKNKIINMNIEHKFSKAIPVVTISQGICCGVPVKGTRVWDFLHIADGRLYKIKKMCRNNYCVGDMYDENNDIIGE